MDDAGSPTRERPLELVVFGATGFTGRLICEHLARTGQRRWGIAGRDYERLRSLRSHLLDLDPEAARIEILVARVEDEGALVAMAERAQVVINAVGPFAEFGEPVVRACIQAGADYVDLTGEPDWWRRMVERYDARAQARDVLVVPACGFDSIPADLGVQYCLDALPRGAQVEVDGFLWFGGTVSGGTWATALEELGHPLRTLRGRDAPWTLHRGAGGRGPHFARTVGRWVAPMPTLDTLVVRRSFGDTVSFRYYLELGSVVQLAALLGGVGALAMLAPLPAIRRRLRSFRPSGAGPDARRRERSWFRITFVAHGEGGRVTVEVRGGDPGYGEASKMIAEAARCLARQRASLPRSGGVCTPAAAMGPALRERLEAVGITFRVVEREPA